mgnify:FL=1
MKIISDQAWPVIKEVYEKHSAQYEYIIIPVSDGRRVFNLRVNLKRAYETQAREVVKDFEKVVMLVTIDETWKEHLRDLDDLKQSVQNASYEQKDPLVIFKIESNNLFDLMLDKNNKAIISTIMKGHIPIQNPENIQRAPSQAPRMPEQTQLRTQKAEVPSASEQQQQQQQPQQRQQPKVQPVRTGEKIGRNDPCPCGSGKKYKNCHGKGL